jgi:phage gpG-like protein
MKTDMESYRGKPLRHMGELPSMLASRYGDRNALIGSEQT